MAKLLCRILSCLCMALMYGSCIYEYPPELDDEGGGIDRNNIVLQLNIKTLAASASDNPTEKIKSLRVVIIGKGEAENEPDTIECNRLIGMPVMAAKDYSYILMWNSRPGKKDIFVIANEASIDDVITDLLDGYDEKKPAGDFAEWINGYSFNPSYTVDANNNIYLPYSFSQEGIEPKAEVVNTINAWLIPVATKFIFNFTNNRTNGVNVNGISMAYANTSNYLLAKPGEGELEKELNGKTLGWVDWLAEVSKNSWAYPDYGDNEVYNGQVGWISDYSMPNSDDPDDYYVYEFVEEGSADIFTVDGATKKVENGEETIIPGKHSTPVYYLPESANYERLGADAEAEQSPGAEGEEKEQRFYLTILFQDKGPSTAPDFTNVAIPNLKSLFRNTYVVINIKMSEGDIEVYGEIAPWNFKTANGWVNEAPAPNPNPFSIRRKW